MYKYTHTNTHVNTIKTDTLDGIIITPPLDLRGGWPDAVGQSWGGVGGVGGVGQSWGERLGVGCLYFEKIRTCVHLSHIEKSIIYQDN